MRSNNAPDFDCPDCGDHPPLVYENSIGPVEPRISASDGMIHWYRCAVCGGKYHGSTDGQPIASQSNRELERPMKKCVNCGEAMRTQRVAKEFVSSGPRRYGGQYERVETLLVWLCEKCGSQDEFKHVDVLGYN
jgi:hypothetical protein